MNLGQYQGLVEALHEQTEILGEIASALRPAPSAPEPRAFPYVLQTPKGAAHMWINTVTNQQTFMEAGTEPAGEVWQQVYLWERK